MPDTAVTHPDLAVGVSTERRMLCRQAMVFVVVALPPVTMLGVALAFLAPRCFDRVAQAVDRWACCTHRSP